MTVVFIGGSRSLAGLNDIIRSRIDNILRHNLALIIGDANGVDKAIQIYVAGKEYKNVTIYCTGEHCRNNLGNWTTRIQDVFRSLSNDDHRNRRIARDINEAYQEGRKIIVLTERTEHLGRIREALGDAVGDCYVLHGRLSKRQRTEILAALSDLDDSAPRVIIATGRLVGEGFDCPPLDTLVLAMPISWKGTIQQYAGRLHRDHAGKKEVRMYDYIEHNHPPLGRRWSKRLATIGR